MGHVNAVLAVGIRNACIGCHGCESRCPFGVKIADRMTKTAELFRER